MANEKRTREVVAAELATVKQNHDAMANDPARLARLDKLRAADAAADREKAAAKARYTARYNELKLATGLFVRGTPGELDDGSVAETFEPSPAAMAFCEKFFDWKWGAQGVIDRSSGAQQMPFRAMLEAVVAAELAKDETLVKLDKEQYAARNASSAATHEVRAEENQLARLDGEITRLTRELNEIDAREAERVRRKAAADPQAQLDEKAFEQKRAAVREKLKEYMPTSDGGWLSRRSRGAEALHPKLAEFAEKLKADVAAATPKEG